MIHILPLKLHKPMKSHVLLMLLHALQHHRALFSKALSNKKKQEKENLSVTKRKRKKTCIKCACECSCHAQKLKPHLKSTPHHD